MKTEERTDRIGIGTAPGSGGRTGETATGSGGRTAAAALVLLAVTLLAAGPAAAQEDPGAEPEAPDMAAAPTPFHLGPSVSVLSWEETGDATLEDATLWGLDVERMLTSFLAVRLDGGFGKGEVTEDGRTVELNTYLFELALALRLPVAPLARVGVTPYAVAGLGTVVHDPTAAELNTASQNALSYGLGVDVQPFERFGARLEWRRYSVDREKLLDPTDRTGTSRDADRFQASLYWAF